MTLGLDLHHTNCSIYESMIVNLLPTSPWVVGVVWSMVELFWDEE